MNDKTAGGIKVGDSASFRKTVTESATRSRRPSRSWNLSPDQGVMMTGVPTSTSANNSRMSPSHSAMQPSVQSRWAPNP